MDEFIKREDALKIIDNYSSTVTADGKVVVNAIRDIVAVITPTADVAPKSEVAREVLSDIKKLVHNKMVHAVSQDEYSYINIKVFDAILQNYLNNLK